MKKMVLVIALIAMAFSGSAFAQDLIWQNNVGVYFDEGATNFCGTADNGAIVTAYLVLSNMTEDNCKGYEIKLVTEGGFQLVGKTHPVNVVDVGTKPGEQIVGYDVPVPAVNGKVTMATFSFYVSDASVSSFATIERIYFPSIPGVPSYLTDAGDIIEMRQSTGGPYDPVFILNGDCLGPVATEETTFDNLKSLYR